MNLIFTWEISTQLTVVERNDGEVINFLTWSKCRSFMSSYSFCSVCWNRVQIICSRSGWSDRRRAHSVFSRRYARRYTADIREWSLFTVHFQYEWIFLNIKFLYNIISSIFNNNLASKTIFLMNKWFLALVVLFTQGSIILAKLAIILWNQGREERSYDIVKLGKPNKICFGSVGNHSA